MAHHFRATRSQETRKNEIELYPLNGQHSALDPDLEQRLKQFPSSIIYAFKSPSALDSFLSSPGPHQLPPISILTSQIINIVIYPLLSIPSTTYLTPIESMGAISDTSDDTVPTIGPLVNAWRSAFRSVPDNHSFEVVIFDFNCNQAINVDHVIRLLQQISTVLYMKRKKQPEQDRRGLRFEVAGVGEKNKDRLEKAMPSLDDD